MHVHHNKTTHCIATNIIKRLVLLVAPSALRIVTKLGIIQHQTSGITKEDKQENLRLLTGTLLSNSLHPELLINSKTCTHPNSKYDKIYCQHGSKA